jgi:hypothetical protein
MLKIFYETFIVMLKTQPHLYHKQYYENIMLHMLLEQENQLD